MLSVLTILIGKYVTIYAAGCAAVGPLTTALFVYPAVIVCYLIIVNLFVAILLESFSADDTEAEADVATTPATAAAAAPGAAPAAAPAASDTYNWARRLTESPSFETAIVILIGVSSLALAVDVPRLPRDSLTKLVLDNVNYLFTFIFTFEMGAKMYARGTRFYFSSYWNVLDFVLVTSSLLGLLAKARALTAPLRSPRSPHPTCLTELPPTRPMSPPSHTPLALPRFPQRPYIGLPGARVPHNPPYPPDPPPPPPPHARPWHAGRHGSTHTSDAHGTSIARNSYNRGCLLRPLALWLPAASARLVAACIRRYTSLTPNGSSPA